MRRAGKREGRKKRTTALEAGLKGAGGGSGGGGGVVPGKQTTGEKGQSLEARRQEGGRHQGHSLDFIANCLLWESGVHEHQARGWGGFMTKKA